jgi:acetyltransferase-like isoleucine patch superfamily enzyme
MSTPLDVESHLALIETIKRHPAWKAQGDLDGAGVDFDSLRALSRFRSDDSADVAQLATLGILVEGGPCQPKRASDIFADPNDSKARFRLSVGGAQGAMNCTIVFAPSNVARGSLNANSHGHLLLFGGSVGHTQTIDVQMRGPECLMAFGHQASSFGIRCAIEGPRTCVVLGQDCMASEGIRISATDSHGIISLETGQVINAPADVIVEQYVWLGVDSMILKGVRIGRGAIVGARALVASDVPACSLAVGVPARIARTKVTWTRREAYTLMGKRWRMDDQFRLTEWN